MHVRSAWLPPPVAAQTGREAGSFAAVVRSIRASWRPQDPDTAYSTLKWISLVDTFLKARSEVSLEDVDALVVVGLEVFQASQNKLYVQVRWGTFLTKLLRKFGKKLSVKVQWRPFYDSLINTHFKRNTGPEGWRLKQQHFEALTYLVQSCRKYFPSGSAYEIWDEFRSLLENPWHNSSFEGSGLVKLFLPMNIENEEFFTIDWIKQCIDLWDSVPNCQFWDAQWASVIARCIKNYKSLDWECFVPALFTKFLNMFEVPIASGSGSYPFSLEVPRNIKFLFSSKTGTPAKAISNSIVHLLKPGSSSQEQFERLADLLEQFYHPSNGGRWTYSLDRFLRYLVIAFEKRLKQEQFNTSDSKLAELYLGDSERASFVKAVLKLIERGQYSKNEALAETVAVAMSILSYVEPSVILPFITSRFHLALETDTAIHQLKTAITSTAFAARPFFFASVSPCSSCDNIYPETFVDLLVVSVSNSLLGIDANDPPKTLASMQLIGSVFSNLPILSDDNQPAFLQINFSEWLDEFFSRLFSLLLHLEPRSVLVEDAQISTSSRTFLVDNPYYFSLLEGLLGKMSKPLYMQVLKKISKFVNTNVLPGATSEVGLLCCACVHANPEVASHHLIEPILMSAISYLKETTVSGYGGKGITESSFLAMATVSPALETALEYHLKVLSVAITYGGPLLLHYKKELKGAIASAFEAPSWKVNIAGDHLLRSLLGSLVLYYPTDQYKSYKQHPAAAAMEEWLRSKFDEEEDIQFRPIWHIPSKDELLFASELMDLHLRSALDDLLKICQTEIHSEAGNKKDHLKVTMLRIFSSLKGVLSCLPDLCPSFSGGKTNDDYFLIAGAMGASVGSRELREKAAQDIHLVCKYLLDERSDDSILLILVIQIMDTLGNVGSLEEEELSSRLQICRMESAAIIEPSCNFIVPPNSKGKKRPRWSLIDKVYMHNTWRSSQSLYYNFRTDSNLSPPDPLIPLMDDLLILSLHRYETVRMVASTSLLKILNRWPSLITKCILILVDKLCEPSTPEHMVLGSCAILASQTILRHLTKDTKAFSSFILGLLASSHHESLKAQKSITELFIKYNNLFSGLPRSFFRNTSVCADGPEFSDLVSQISSISFDSNGLHWRYNLMANRVLLLLTLASKNNSNVPSEVLGKTTGHFLWNLRSELPQSRMLAVSALNSLLAGLHHKHKGHEQQECSELSKDKTDYIISGALREIFQEEGFFDKTLNSLSHVHIIADTESASVRGNRGPLQSVADKAMTSFYFDFSAAWPRTPSWISLLHGDSFYSSFARIFKRLVQECGPPVILALQRTLEEFSNAKERSKQCVAAETMAGILHSDIDEIFEAWESWMAVLLQKIIIASSVESIPDWAACIRYAVTGKGKHGMRTPLLRYKILDCLLSPLPKTVATSIVAKRYTFLLAAFIEISPTRMTAQEVQCHNKLMEELLDNMNHSSAQVREVIGVSLSVLCSNLRRFVLFGDMNINNEDSSVVYSAGGESWAQHLTNRASEVAVNIQNSNHFAKLYISSDLGNENSFSDNELQEDVKRMETMLHFIISSLKSGRSSLLLDIIVGLLYPVFSLQETSHKDLSTQAKAAFELLKWRILPRPYLEKCISLLSSFVCDPNWRTRFSSLSYLRAFMYRHTFILSNSEKSKIWKSVEKLLVDNQVEVREHASGILASLMKGGDENLASSFRDRAFAEALSIHKKRKQRNWTSSQSIASIHGAVLALVASVLSVPYDMPSWLPDHVTLLARFISEPSPVKSTVTKAVAEFRRTHVDTWTIQKDLFTEEQLEVLADTSSSSSYFA